MAPLPKTLIHHFSHEGHPLKAVESEQEFLCDGCKTVGSGKRYRCNGCDFDLHDYCGTCPRLLTSFMHRHSLTLMMSRSQQIDRFCDVCLDIVEGLFYTCKECEFDVHPVCTLLPQKLNHALHKLHPLTLQSSSTPNFCSVCGNYCADWRYRCSICKFDIHLECVLAPVVSYEQTSQRGIPMPGQLVPFQPPPQFVPYYGFYYYSPGYPYYGPGYNAHHGGPHMHMYPQQIFGQLGASNNNGMMSSNRLGKFMFSLVKQLGFGVISNMIFGVDLSSFMG